MDRQALIRRLTGIVGPQGVISERNQLRTYECDGLANFRVIPSVVVLPETADQATETVRACAEAGVPFVARGSGTGLSGGALPVSDGVLIVLARMRRILEIDFDNQRAVVEPGVLNLQVTKEVAPDGFYYAPDPSSQQICSIGGNVAENSGGAHCLKYGFTTNHVTALEVVLPDGELVHLGGDGKAPDPPGYDLLGAFVGSEGTLGITTRITLRLLRKPEAVRTLMAAFDGTDRAGDAVSSIIGAGIVPAAIEMMDALAMEAAEAAVHVHYPEEAGAVLIVELDGPEAEVAHQFDEVERLCREAGSTTIQIAADDDQRALFWKGRKSAFAAVGRISPDYYVQDGVIPRTALPEVLRKISELASERGLRVANVFHAGDGNLHPLVLYDGEVSGQEERAEELAAEILFTCLEHGGSITGEHGVGFDKKQYLPKQFSAADLDAMQLVRCAFDPEGRSNPGKVFPTPRLCGERPGPRRVHPAEEAGLAEVF
jgi:glycolate oxidase